MGSGLPVVERDLTSLAPAIALVVVKEFFSFQVGVAGSLEELLYLLQGWDGWRTLCIFSVCGSRLNAVAFSSIFCNFFWMRVSIFPLFFFIVYLFTIKVSQFCD